MSIRVLGEPQPFPKKDVAIAGGRLIPVDKDYRTRTNPHTGKPEKYDKGFKRRWMRAMADAVAEFLSQHELKPFAKNHPIALGALFFVTKAAKNKLDFPSQKPDEDNLAYALRNALKNCADYPSGALYWDDDQIVWHLQPDGMLWATEQEPPGVLITCCSVYDLPQARREAWDDIQKYANLGVLI